MNSSKFTEFGVAVRVKLIQIGKSQKWLEDEVSQKTGLFVDNSYMHKILTGHRNAPKVVAAIREILSIE